MLFKLAWKNIWRNRTRSLVVISAIALGVWAVIFINSLTSGITRTYIENAVTHELSHIQLHHPQYLIERKLNQTIDISLDGFANNPTVKQFAARTLIDGMISSSKGARGITIRGVDPAMEDSLIKMTSLLQEGSFFREKMRNPIVIGRDVADKLGLSLQRKVVLTFQSENGDIVAGSFKVAGIFSADNLLFEGANVFVNRASLIPLLGSAPIHEIALLTNELDQIDGVQSNLQQQFPNLAVQNFREVSPDIALYDSQIKINQIVILVIIMLALIFGIINTMLMAVLERIRELGMLMAIGMNKSKLFIMIVLETLMLGIIGTPIGMLLGYLIIRYTNQTGINLSNYSKGMRQFGMSEILYPYLESHLFWQLAFAVMATAFLASLYPAFKAMRLVPVEAIRSL